MISPLLKLILSTCICEPTMQILRFYLFVFLFGGCVTAGGGRGPGFHMLFLKAVLFPCVQAVTPLNTLSFCDAFTSQQRK